MLVYEVSLDLLKDKDSQALDDVEDCKWLGFAGELEATDLEAVDVVGAVKVAPGEAHYEGHVVVLADLNAGVSG